MTVDYANARENMIEQQVRPWDVLNIRVLDVLGRLPREAFVPEVHKTLAYVDMELPLGHGAMMMKPVIEGRMLQSIDIQPDETVLEIGTGSGFITACLGILAREVVSLDIEPELIDSARIKLQKLGLDTNVRLEVADAFHYGTSLKFDAVCVTGAVPEIPSSFLKWLRPGGRLFVVCGRAPAMEALIVRARGEADVNAGTVQSLFETDLAYLRGVTPDTSFQF